MQCKLLHKFMASFANQQNTTTAPAPTDLGERASSEAPMQSYQTFLNTLQPPTPQDTTTPENISGPDSIDQIKGQFQGGVSQIEKGAGEFAGHGVIGPVEALGDIGAGAIGAAASPLAPATYVIGGAVQAVSDKIASIPAVQKFANSK